MSKSVSTKEANYRFDKRTIRKIEIEQKDIGPAGCYVDVLSILKIYLGDGTGLKLTTIGNFRFDEFDWYGKKVLK